MNLAEFMTVKEVMEDLGIARPTVYKYVSQGRLTPHHTGIGKTAYFRREEVEKFKEMTPGKLVTKASGELKAAATV